MVFAALPLVCATVCLSAPPLLSANEHLTNVGEWLGAESRRALANPLTVSWTWRADTTEFDNARAAVLFRYSQANDVWHLSQTSESDGASRLVTEYCVNAECAWKVSRAWLYLADPIPPYPSGHPFGQKRMDAARAISLMLRGGLDMLDSPSFRVTNLRLLDDDRWSAIVSQGGLTASIDGHWSNELGRGFVDAVSLDSNQSRYSWTFHDWRWNDHIQEWVAQKVIAFTRDESVCHEIRFESAEAEPLRPDSAIFSTPVLNEFDPKRRHRIEGLTDYQQHPTVHLLASGSAIHRTTDEQLQAHSKSREWGWRIAGWCSCITSILVVLALHAHGRSASTALLEASS